MDETITARMAGQTFFRRSYMAEWLVETESERQLRELGERYHQNCDVYDRRVCSGISPRSGEAIPIDPREQGLSSRHAWQVRKDLIDEGASLGFTQEQVVQSIRDTAR